MQTGLELLRYYIEYIGSEPDDILVQAGVKVAWTTGVNLTLPAEKDIVISGTIQHDGSKSGDGALQLLSLYYPSSP